MLINKPVKAENDIFNGLNQPQKQAIYS